MIQNKQPKTLDEQKRYLEELYANNPINNSVPISSTPITIVAAPPMTMTDRRNQVNDMYGGGGIESYGKWNPDTVFASSPNPMSNGGTGTQMQQAPPLSSAPQQFGMGAVKQTSKFLKANPNIASVSWQQSQLVNQDEIDRTIAENKKKQAEYDSLVPKLVNMNKESIDKYNVSNMPQQTLPTPAQPPTNRKKTFAEMMNPQGYETRDTLGYLSGTGSMRSTPPPVIMSAVPPPMKDIPAAQYVHSTINMNKVNPTGTNSSRGGNQILAYSARAFQRGQDGKITQGGITDPNDYQVLSNAEIYKGKFDNNTVSSTKQDINSKYSGSNTWKMWDYNTNKYIDVNSKDPAKVMVQSIVHKQKKSKEYTNAENAGTALNYDSAGNLTIDPIKFNQYMWNKYRITPDKYMSKDANTGEMIPTQEFTRGMDDLMDSVVYAYGEFMQENQQNERKALTNQYKSNATKTKFGNREADEDTLRSQFNVTDLKIQLAKSIGDAYNSKTKI